MTDNPRAVDEVELRALIAHLERAWQQLPRAGDSVDLNSLVPPGPRRLDLLLELALTDMDIQARRGRRVSLENYLARIPELQFSPRFAELLCKEFRLRQQAGEQPSLAGYRERFPQHFGRFLEQCNQGNEATMATAELRAQKPQPAASTALPDPPDTRVRAEPSAAQPLVTPLPSMAGLYRFLRKLGAGAFGEVWLAEAPGPVEVAIKKIFRSVDQAEGQRELQALDMIKRLRHPYLLQTHSYWQEQDRLCIVMELADGSLKDRLDYHRQQGQPGIPVEELLIYMREAAEALDYLQANRIQHRDVKPGNLLMLQGHVKVADFGLARRSAGHEMSMATMAGSPHYMAPEVWGETVSPTSDQYSLAVSYVELRRGRRPFAGGNMAEAMLAHLQKPPDLEGLTEAEQKVVLRALDKDPARRFGSCMEFAQALTEALMPRPESQVSIPPEPPRPVWPWVVAGASLLGVVVLLGVWAAGWGPFQGQTAGTTAPTPTQTAKKPWLPAGFKPGSQEMGTTPETSHLHRVLVLEKDGLRLEFVLIPGLSSPSLPPFYLLRDKVTVEQFRTLAEKPEFQDQLRQIEKKLPPRQQGQDPYFGNWKAAELTRTPRWPVRAVSVIEAHLFARALGGFLPTALQWDRAAGYYEAKRDPGPFKFDPQNPNDFDGIAINRAEPAPVGTSPRDVSRHDCRDMAGNGLEWTRDCPTDSLPDRKVPLEKPEVLDRVVLRGWAFTKQKPFLFENGFPPPKNYLEVDDQLGFRVVLEIPAP